MITVQNEDEKIDFLVLGNDRLCKVIADELQNIYLEQGPPNIKLIYSRPFHPQSQGKIERSHRSLTSKREYDFLKMGRKRR